MLDRLVRLGQPLLDPGQGKRQGRTLPLQPPDEFRYERRRHRGFGARHVGNHQNEALGILSCNLYDLIRPGVGKVTVHPAGGDVHPDAAKILDQRQPQHDRDGPQFSQLEIGDRLVGCDETPETLGIDPAISVGDRLQGDVINPRKAGGRASREQRQFAAVALGKMALGRADLLLDQVEIIVQPLACRCQQLIRRYCLGQYAADIEQLSFVLIQAGQKLIRAAAGRQLVRGRQNPAVQFHLVRAEQLRSQRKLFAQGSRLSDITKPARNGAHYPGNTPVPGIHAGHSPCRSLSTTASWRKPLNNMYVSMWAMASGKLETLMNGVSGRPMPSAAEATRLAEKGRIARKGLQVHLREPLSYEDCQEAARPGGQPPERRTHPAVADHSPSCSRHGYPISRIPRESQPAGILCHAVIAVG